MITKPTSRTVLRDAFLEMFLAETNKVSKVSKGSLISATGHGVAALSQRILKDIAVLESNIFPESAFGTLLDSIALRNGIPSRFGQLGASTFVRLVADVGTTYTAGVHTFTGKNGIVFDLEDDITIGVHGFGYAKVTASTQGAQTKIDPLTITQVLPSAPVGHVFVTNEFAAQNGRDNESDDIFRSRIKEGVNVLATGTLAQLEQVFMKINSNVLRVYKGGTNASNQFKIILSSVNGADFTVSELEDIAEKSNEFLSLTEQQNGLELINIDYSTLDVTMRVEVDPDFDNDTVRKNIQTQMQKKLDWRFWEFGDRIEWEDLLFIAKQTKGVLRVPDNFFFINGVRADITPNNLELPRIQSFTMYDLNGVILSDTTGVLSPTFFPNQPDFVLQQTLYSAV